MGEQTAGLFAVRTPARIHETHPDYSGAPCSAYSESLEVGVGPSRRCSGQSTYPAS